MVVSRMSLKMPIVYDDDYLVQLVTNYLPLLPDEILLHILNFTDDKYVFEFLMYLNFLKPIIHQEYLQSLEIELKQDSVEIQTSKTPLLKGFRLKPEIYCLRMIPGDLKVKSIHISSSSVDFDILIDFLSSSTILDITNEIRISTRLRNKDRDKFHVLLDIPNLSHLQLEYKFNKGPLFDIEFSITNKDDLINLQRFEKKFKKKYLNHLELIDMLPANTIACTCDRLNNIDHLQQLKSLTITECPISLNLPTTLEELTISDGCLTGTQSGDTWLPNLKRFKFFGIVDDMILAQLPNWSPSLKTLDFDFWDNAISDWSYFERLPENLEKLKIHFHRRNRGIAPYTFPRSLQSLDLYQIDFRDSSNEVTVFPNSLIEIQLDLCSFKSFERIIFPVSLKTLSITFSGIKELNSYNNTSLNKNWQQLENLQKLILRENLLTSNELRDWIPPSNLNLLDFGENAHLESLDISIFKESMAPYTRSITEISFAQCNVKEIPINMYLPINLQVVDLVMNNLSSGFIPLAISRHKKLTTLILSHNQFDTISFESESEAHDHENLLPTNLTTLALPFNPPALSLKAIEEAFVRKILNIDSGDSVIIGLGRPDSA